MTNRTLSYAIFLLIIFKITAIYFTNFGLYGDEAQYWLWSQAPDFGYYSKPPLLAWFLYGYTAVFGDSFFSLKVFPIIIYFKEGRIHENKINDDRPVAVIFLLGL